MARAWRNNNQSSRRQGALMRLASYKFFPKTLKNGHERTQEEWEANRLQTIENLNNKGVR